MEVYSFKNVYSLTGVNFKVANTDVQKHNGSTESELIYLVIFSM